MLGGIAMLGVMTLVANALATYGLETIFEKVVEGLVEKGTSKSKIRKKVNSYPISKDLKTKILRHLESV